jgi:hypothetical protein
MDDGVRVLALDVSDLEAGRRLVRPRGIEPVAGGSDPDRVAMGVKDLEPPSVRA